MLALARRAATLAVATLALVAVSGSYGHIAGYETTVKSGRWHGVKWKFTARTGSDGSYCLDMEISGQTSGRGCGSIRGSRISYAAHFGRPAPNYVIGPVIATARSVEIRFFDRPPLRRSTIAPSPPLDPGIRFFVAVLACPATPRSFVARNGAGRIVARIVAHRPEPRLVC